MMPRNNSVSGIIFDLDGTLADTIGDLGGSVNAALSARGLPSYGMEDFKRMVGDGFPNLVHRALPPALAAEESLFEAVLSDARSRYKADCLKTTQPFDGVPELLASLAAGGIVCAVLSNKPQELSQTMVKALFPGFRFASIFGERPGVPRKPDPRAALEIAQNAGVPKEEWAFVGDSGVDMRTACGAGMQAWGASWGYRSVQELREGGAQAIFASPADLLKAVF